MSFHVVAAALVTGAVCRGTDAPHEGLGTRGNDGSQRGPATEKGLTRGGTAFRKARNYDLLAPCTTVPGWQHVRSEIRERKSVLNQCVPKC